MRTPRSLFLALLSAAMVLSCKPTQTGKADATGPGNASRPTAASTEAFPFIILQINDVYEISPLKDGRGGMARLSSLRRQLLAMNPNVITVLSGDYLSPSLIGSLKCSIDGTTGRIAGRQMVDCLNAMKLDYATYGNHEFDISEADHLALTEASDFKLISANVQHSVGGRSEPFMQRGNPVPGHIVHTFHLPSGGSFRLGLIGVTLDANQQKWVSYLNPYAAFDKEAAYLRSTDKADAIIGITHLSKEMDDTLARRVPGISLILGGHEHTAMKFKSGNTTILKADANAKTAWIHFCRYDPATKTLSADHLLYPITDALPDDPNVTMAVRKWESIANDCMLAQGYKPTDTIGFYMKPLDGRESSVRFNQTNLGQLITKAMLELVPTAQVAVLNSGSIRIDDQLSGLITIRDILAVLPFGGSIQVGDVSGADLKRLLDAGLAESNRGDGSYLQYAGVKPLGSGMYEVGGAPIEPTKTYKVLMPGYLAAGNERKLPWVKNIANFQDATLPNGVRNDLRDIVIFSMRRTRNFQQMRQMLLEQQMGGPR